MLHASCFMIAKEDCEINSNFIEDSRKVFLEMATCRVLASWRVLSSSNIFVSSGYLLSLVLFTRALIPPNFYFSQPFILPSTSSHFFLPSSATALCTSISIIGKLLVHTLCILRTFCSHPIHLATHLRHHPNTLCKITASSSSLMTTCSQTSQCPLPRLLVRHLLNSTWSISSVSL